MIIICTLQYGDTLQIALEFGNVGFRGEEKLEMRGKWRGLVARDTSLIIWRRQVQVLLQGHTNSL